MGGQNTECRHIVNASKLSSILTDISNLTELN